MSTWQRRKLSAKARFPRLGMCWNVLRGHPVAYRIKIENGGLVIDGQNAMIIECVIIGP